MKCPKCGEEFGNGNSCAHCGVDRVSAFGEYIGFDSNNETGSIAKDGYSNHPMSYNTAVCYSCGNVIPSDAKFCPYCHIELFVNCPKCGHRYSSQFPGCPECGTDRAKYLAYIAEQEAKRREEMRIQEQAKRRQEILRQQQEAEENRRKAEQAKRREEENQRLYEERQRERSQREIEAKAFVTRAYAKEIEKIVKDCRKSKKKSIVGIIICGIVFIAVISFSIIQNNVLESKILGPDVLITGLCISFFLFFVFLNRIDSGSGEAKKTREFIDKKVKAYLETQYGPTLNRFIKQ